MSKFVDSKVLENLMIDEDIIVTEASSATIDLIGGAILIGGALAYTKYKEGKKEKQRTINSQQLKQQRDTKAFTDFKDLNEKFNFMESKESYNKFIQKILDDMENDIKKMVATANRDKARFEKIKNKLRDTFDYSDSDIKQLRLGPGYYKCYTDGDDYWVIIEDQDVACVDDLHYAIVEALEAKASQDKRYSLISLSNGDGDEGCVYYNYSSYDALKKKYPNI